jgi:hypothetical protein
MSDFPLLKNSVSVYQYQRIYVKFPQKDHPKVRILISEYVQTLEIHGVLFLLYAGVLRDTQGIRGKLA